MPATVIVGLQWGDEGKGKTTDFLAEQVAMVVRYQGGDNAGHTVVIGDEVFKLRLDAVGRALPAHHVGHRQRRRRQPGDADRRARHARRARASTSSRVRVSRSAHVIMPYHVALDRANEARLGGAKVGTTGRGIGPAYGDRAWRLGLRMEDLLDRDVLRERLARAAARQERCCSRSMGADELRGRARSSSRRSPGASGCAPHLDDTTWLVQDALARGEHVLLEGAQGTLLDLDHGSYPFVTSSNPVAGGACTGGGIGPLQVDEVIGVMKAYSTRVGLGPVPDRAARRDRRRASPSAATSSGRSPAGRGGSAGSTPCRCATRSRSTASARIMLNKLDILSGIDTIRAVRRLRDRRASGSRRGRRAATRSRARRRSTSEFPGWSEPIHDVRSLADLPENARRYVTALEEHAGVPIVLVSVGPERTQTIERAWRPMRHRPAVAGVSAREPASCRPGSSSSAAAAASTRSPGSWPPSRASTRSSSRPGSAAIATEPRVRCVAGVDPLDAGRGRRASPGARRPSWSSSGPRRRWRPASPTRCARPGSPVFGPTRGGGPDRDRARRSATRSPRPPASRWPRAGRSTTATAAAARSRASSRRAATASSSRPTAWRPARASRSATPGRGGRGARRARGDARRARRRRPRRRRGAARRAARRASSRSATAATRVALPLARDHKRLRDGDRGPNTGGMGAYSPAAGPRRRRRRRPRSSAFHRPILAELARRGTPFRRRPLRRPDADRRRARSCSSATPASATPRRR